MQPRPTALWSALFLVVAGMAQAASESRLPAVEVTSSKAGRAQDTSTARITVISGEDLRRRGASDLRSALARVAGVEISEGGDGGPASTVPAFWGLREFDAFLLVVDGVPWGGAFVPALASLDLSQVERIEVLRGAAPVSYGATAFVGVIHVIHYAPGAQPGQASVSAGSRGSWRGSLALPLGAVGAGQHSLLLDGEDVELSNQRSGWRRGHALYRLALPAGDGEFGLDADLSFLRQQPTSPVPRAGAVLSPLVPLDSNHNPAHARLDEDRLHVAARYAQPSGWGDFSATAAWAHTEADLVRGFLGENFAAASGNNAVGYRQDRGGDDWYLDAHWETALGESSTLVWGADYLGGRGDQQSANFGYRAPLSGIGVPSSGSRPVDEYTETEDQRDFLGLYTDWGWTPTDALRVDAGLRWNHTREDRETGASAPGGAEVEGGTDSRSISRLSGALGASWRAWGDAVDGGTLYANYKSTFKPAVIDFGPEAEADILEPEYSTSGELGLRGSAGRLAWDLSAFYMDFRNLVVPANVNGTPGLDNIGTLHLRGAELEADFAVSDQLRLLGRWSYHDTRFGDTVRLFGSSTRQLLGNRHELSPQHLGALGLDWAPLPGLDIALTGSRVGNRWLNARNTARVSDYSTWDASVRYTRGDWSFHLTGSNLSDRREATSESELGDASYYLTPARTWWGGVDYRFD